MIKPILDNLQKFGKVLFTANAVYRYMNNAQTYSVTATTLNKARGASMPRINGVFAGSMKSQRQCVMAT